MKKPTILILLAHYLPGVESGGPQTTLSNMVEMLKDDYKLLLITYDRDSTGKEPYKEIVQNEWNQVGAANVFYVEKTKYAAIQIIKLISKTTYDILYINPFFEPVFSFSIILAYKLRIIEQTKIVLAPRGELFSEALAIKPFKKYIFIRFYKFFNLYEKIVWHASTVDEAQSIKKSLPIKDENIRIARNLSVVNKQEGINIEKLKIKYFEMMEGLNIVYISRIAVDKNTIYLFKLLTKIKNVKINLDVYGPIRDDDYWKKCLACKESYDSEITVSYKGVVERKNVVEVISKYDVFCLPTFAENFGHAIVESISASTPVLISNNTPWKNLEQKELGWDIDLKNEDLFIETIKKISGLTQNEKWLMKIKVLDGFEKIKSQNMDLVDNINLFKD